MNHSKYGLNEPFYKWIDEVRRAKRKEKELLEKLEYYNVKFMGYKGVNYGGLPGGGRSKGDEDMLYWLDKIDEVGRRLSRLQPTIEKYNIFLNLLESNEKALLSFIIESSLATNDYCEKFKMSKQRYYDSINLIARKQILIEKFKKK
jgi:hypothetical protein